MRLAGGASGDRDDRGWDAGPIRRARSGIVNRATRFVVAGTGIAGLGATIAAVALTAGDGWGNPWVILLLALPVAIGWAYPLRVLRNEEAETMHLDEAYFVIAVLLLPPMGAMAVFLLGTAAGLLWSRTVFAKFIFNLGQVMLSVVVGTHDLRAHQHRGSWRSRAERGHRSGRRRDGDGCRRTAGGEPGHLGQ